MSELSAGYLWGIIAITAISALALRATPLLIKQRIAGSPFAHHFGLWLPLGAMVILVGYSIATVDYWLITMQGVVGV